MFGGVMIRMYGMVILEHLQHRRTSICIRIGILKITVSERRIYRMAHFMFLVMYLIRINPTLTLQVHPSNIVSMVEQLDN